MYFPQAFVTTSLPFLLASTSATYEDSPRSCELPGGNDYFVSAAISRLWNHANRRRELNNGDQCAPLLKGLIYDFLQISIIYYREARGAIQLHEHHS